MVLSGVLRRKALSLLSLLILVGSTAGTLEEAQVAAYRAAGHLARAVPSTAKRLLQVQDLSRCTPSQIPEFQCQLEVSGQGEHSIPAGWVRLHWAVDQANPGLGDGVAFGAEAFSWRNEQDQLLQPGWVGLGFSEEAPPSHPPQMINGTAIFGYFDANRAPQINVYDLKAKNVLQVLPQRQGFTIANQSLELTPDLHLVLRFRRSFDNSFTLTGQTSLIMAFHKDFHGLLRHNYRSGLKVTFSQPGSARTVPLRLNDHLIQAHAWSMFVAWGVILPMGVIGARYFKDVYGKWYFLHMINQVFGLLLAIAAALITLTHANPFPRSLRHFQLGIAVLLMGIAQPLTSIPRFMTHHTHYVTSVWWAYLHWTLGRAAVIFGWVNMFLGIGRYRTWFTLGSWAEPALGCYIGGIILLGLAMEAFLWNKHDRRLREENDELSRRITHLEAATRHAPGSNMWVNKEDDEDDLELDRQLDQVPRSKRQPKPGSAQVRNRLRDS